MKLPLAILVCGFGALLIGSAPCTASKILAIFPTFTKSHWNVGHGVIAALLEQGHEVGSMVAAIAFF